MKGRVGLVGWPVADGLPTLVVTHQLQVERRTGKVRWPETDVLPLCYATNQSFHVALNILRKLASVLLYPKTLLSKVQVMILLLKLC